MRLLRGVPFVIALAVSAYSFFMPAPDLPTTVDIWDKLGHGLIFAVLALTGVLAGWRVRPLFAWLFGYAVLTEILQALLPIQRDGDWHDVLADTVGLLAGLALGVVSGVVWGVAIAHLTGRRDRAAAPPSTAPHRARG